MCIKHLGRRVSDSSGLEGDKAMKASIFSLILASASAKPQFEALKSVFGTGLEQAPYTTLKEFDVGFLEKNTWQEKFPT